MMPISLLADGAALLLSLLPIAIFVLVLATMLAAMAFWVWMLVDCITNKTLSDTDRVVWVLVVVFLHFIGGLIYYFVGRNGNRTTGPSM